MTKYHLKDNGDPGKCSAQPGKCPKTNDDGSPQEHYDTPEEAAQAFEKNQKTFPKLVNRNPSSNKDIFHEPPSYKKARDEMVEKYNSNPVRIKIDQRNMMTRARKMSDDKLDEALESSSWKGRKDLEVVLQDERNKRMKQKHEVTDYQRNEFFTRKDQLSNYTLIDPETGSVFSTNSVVMEEPNSEDFYEFPENFTDDYDSKPIEEVRDLREYKNPIIMERDTEIVVSAHNVHAVNHGKEVIDFDEILESDREAANTAYSNGFPLWDKK